MYKLAIAFLLLVAACAQNPTGNVVAENDIVISGLFGLTGYSAFAGEAARNGFIMAIEDSKTSITYIIEDHHSDLSDTVTAVHKLHDTNDVNIIIGPEWNEFSEVIIPFTYDGELIFLSPWMTSEDEWVNAPYYFTATASERHQLSALADYIAEHNRTLVLVYARNSWSKGNVELFKEENTVEVIGEFVVEQDETDYRTILTQIKQLNPDGIYVVLPTDQGQILFNKQYYELGLRMQMYIPFSRSGSSALQTQDAQILQQIIYPAPKAYNRSEEFSEKYELRFGKKPAAISAATSYDLTTLVIDAINQGATTPEDIRQYFMSVNYTGYSNTIIFDNRGQLAHEEVVLKKTNGLKPEIIG